MEVVVSQIEDLDKLASCHKKAFPHALSSSMGKPFIRKMLSWYILSERGILIHVLKDGHVIGYCGGIKTKKAGLPGAATSITQYSFKTFLSSFLIRPWLIFHAENKKRLSFIKRNLQYKIGLKKPSTLIMSSVTREEFVPFWGLVVIGVDPQVQGKGAGSMMLQEFERLAKSDAAKKLTLSVKPDNQKAIKAYEQNGWIAGAISEESLNMNKLL
ncbi:MAG: GNAT family N-acetyltransferase [Ferruginibacter sp.]|nr:GNAT family N-acetyltransferase [Ferruginibacter sp.]